MGDIAVSYEVCPSNAEQSTAVCYDYCQLDSILGAGVCASIGTSVTDKPSLCNNAQECFRLEVTGGYFGAATIPLASCHEPGQSCDTYAALAGAGFGGATL